MYLIVTSRAGLVALVFALIISFVSAAPIPISASQSGLSSTLSSHSSGQDLIYHDTDKSPQIQPNGPISTVFVTTRALTVNNTPIDADNHLVRRNARLNAKIRAAFRKFGRAIKHVAQKIGAGIKKVAQKIGAGIKKVAQKIGNGIKTAAKKVGTFFKQTGAKIAKFGLKVVAVVTKVAAKVVGWIPGGKILGKGLEGISKAADIGSDRIHANLGRKLEKGMNVMNKADKVLGYIPRRRDLSADEGFQ